MVETRQQAAAKKKAPIVKSSFIPPPRVSGYTFVDEKGRSHTIYPQRWFGRRPDGTLYPTRPAPCGPSLPMATIAQKAAETDEALWASSSSFEEYEARKQASCERAFEERKAVLESQGRFDLFPRLPIELRNKIWAFAMEEPTAVEITCSGYSPRVRRGCLIGEQGPPRLYTASAMMPAFFLINLETYAEAANHYRRVFRGINGGGGVLGAYPINLTVETSTLALLHQKSILDPSKRNDFNLVREATVDFRSSGVFLTADGGKCFRQLLAGQNLRKLEIKFVKTPIDWKELLYGVVKGAYDHIRHTRLDWIAPETRIVFQKDGEEDDVVFSYEGGVLEFPALDTNRLGRT